MMDLRMLVPIFGILLVMIPVAGLTLALTLRFAVKPFVETLAGALRESGSGYQGNLNARLEDLHDEIQLLTSEVGRIREAQSFEQELLLGKVRNTEAQAPDSP